MTRGHWLWITLAAVAAWALTTVVLIVVATTSLHCAHTVTVYSGDTGTLILCQNPGQGTGVQP